MKMQQAQAVSLCSLHEKGVEIKRSINFDIHQEKALRKEQLKI
jgi:hypothetical protein